MTGNVYNLKLHVIFSFLVPLRRSGRGNSCKVGISPLLVINFFWVLMLCFVFLWHLVFLLAIGEAGKCLAGCQVTKHSFDKCLLTAWVFWIWQKQGGHACI